jgi:hypothetical protein
MMVARVLCAIGLIIGLSMIICPVRVFKIRNIIRGIFKVIELEASDFKVYIYRVVGAFDLLIFALLLTQTY